MPNQTLYVSQTDKPIWEAAARVARRNGTSLSRFVTEALERHVPAAAEAPTVRERWDAVAADAA